MEIFFSKLVVFLTVRRNLCIRTGHYITCTADYSFYGRCNYGIYTNTRVGTLIVATIYLQMIQN